MKRDQYIHEKRPRKESIWQILSFSIVVESMSQKKCIHMKRDQYIFALNKYEKRRTCITKDLEKEPIYCTRDL